MRCGTPVIIYIPASTRSGTSGRGTGLSLAVKIADNRNYFDMHDPSVLGTVDSLGNTTGLCRA